MKTASRTLTTRDQWVAAADFVRETARREARSVESVCGEWAGEFGVEEGELIRAARELRGDPAMLSWTYHDQHSAAEEEQILEKKLQASREQLGFGTHHEAEDAGGGEESAAEAVRAVMSLIAPALLEVEWAWGRWQSRVVPAGAVVDFLAGEEMARRGRPRKGVCEGGSLVSPCGEVMEWERGVVICWESADRQRVVWWIRNARGSYSSKKVRVDFRVWGPTKRPADRAVANAAAAAIIKYFPNGVDGLRQKTMAERRGVSRQALFYHGRRLEERIAALAAANG